MSTVAGTGVQGYSGDGGLATNAQLNNPQQIALDRDGTLYIADMQNNRVRRVDRAGNITTVAGNGSIGGANTGNGLPATQIGVWAPSGVATDRQGNLYISDRGNRVIRKVRPDSTNTIVVGFYRGIDGFNGDGLPGTQTRTSSIQDLAVDPDGNLFFVDAGNNRVRKLNTEGIVSTVAGNGTEPYSGDGGPATRAGMHILQGVAIGPDRTLYLSTFGAPGRRVRAVGSALPGFAGVGDIVIAAQDGSELYVFNENGRHLRTINPMTNSLVYAFGYDSARRLVTVTDANNNVTTITRDASGNVTGITGPYGQSNSITLDANDYLASITNPNGETTSFSYTAEGLLTSATPPGKPASTFQYDSGGRLVQTSDSAGGGETVASIGWPKHHPQRLRGRGRNPDAHHCHEWLSSQ